MNKFRLFGFLLGLVALAGIGATLLVQTERARTSAWREAFGLRLDALKARGRPTSYADLNAGRPPVLPEQNGAELVAALPVDYRALANGSPGVYYNPFPGLLAVQGPKPEVEAAAKAALRHQEARLQRMWGTLDTVSGLESVQGVYMPPSHSGGELHHGIRCIEPLLTLRAWARPERRFAIALQALTLAGRIECHGGYYYFERENLLRAGLRLLQFAMERGDHPSSQERADLGDLLRGFEEDALPDFRETPDFCRVYWAHYADPTLGRWSRISDYDQFGEGWKLYRDMIRAFDRLEVVEEEMRSEAGIRAIGARDEQVATWNSQLPGLGDRAGEALEVLTLLRLAALALDAEERLGTDGATRSAGRALADELLRHAGRDALTGEAFVVHEEGSSLFISVPWRETDFTLRPAFVREPRRSGDPEPPPTWADDELREDGWIWRIP